MNRTEYIGKLNALYVGEKNCLEELITAYDEKDKEIERLTELCNKYEEEHKTTFETWQKDIKENKRLHSIIKEAIEYIEDNSDDMHTYISQVLTDILKGSDKE